MSEMQKALYKSLLLRDMNTIMGGSGGVSKSVFQNIVMQLRKCCGHPYLFEGQEDRSLDPLGEHVVENCGKMVLMDKLLKKLKQRGSRVLHFTQMTRVLDNMEYFCRMRQYDYCCIDGQTSYEDRESSIDEYNRPNSSKFLFLLSTRAGGLGINLYTADVVVLYDSDWNRQADLQAQDRAHRIGQKKEVNVYRLVTTDSVEGKIIERAQQKLKLDAELPNQQIQFQRENYSASISTAPGCHGSHSWAIPPSELELTDFSHDQNIGGDFVSKWLDAGVVVNLFIADATHSSFEDEVHLWQKLRHPNVIKMYGASNAGPLLNFFVCKFASKGSLKELTAWPSVAGCETWKYLYEAALGLEFLHERGIVHGDLRCSNILIGGDDLAQAVELWSQ